MSKNKKNKRKTTSDIEQKINYENKVFDEKEANKKYDEISKISDHQRKYPIKNKKLYHIYIYFIFRKLIFFFYLFQSLR